MEVKTEPCDLVVKQEIVDSAGPPAETVPPAKKKRGRPSKQKEVLVVEEGTLDTKPVLRSERTVGGPSSATIVRTVEDKHPTRACGWKPCTETVGYMATTKLPSSEPLSGQGKKKAGAAVSIEEYRPLRCAASCISSSRHRLTFTYYAGSEISKLESPLFQICHR